MSAYRCKRSVLWP